MLHSYVFFPFLLKVLAKSAEANKSLYAENDEELPSVGVLMAVHNEEEVILKKIHSVFNSNYPSHKIHLFIGSDNSTDKTDFIISDLQKEFPRLYFRKFNRTGKAGIINQLEQDCEFSVLILTDANVFFDSSTIFQLVKNFKNPGIALVGGNILNEKFKFEEISFQEKKYLERENVIKYREGLIWGAMIGAFGGCYAIKKEFYVPVPKNFLVDDFYITMKVLEKDKKAINEPDAICYEDVSDKISEEFRRKVRISAGNFQNLKVFSQLLWPPFTGVAFCFFSHKVLRWVTPFMLIFTMGLNLQLLDVHPVYRIFMLLQFMLLALPLLDTILKRVEVNLKLLRFVTHFYSMNLALLVGFFKYSSGVKTNIWRPTERNQ